MASSLYLSGPNGVYDHSSVFGQNYENSLAQNRSAKIPLGQDAENPDLCAYIHASQRVGSQQSLRAPCLSSQEPEAAQHGRPDSSAAGRGRQAPPTAAREAGGAEVGAESGSGTAQFCRDKTPASGHGLGTGEPHPPSRRRDRLPARESRAEPSLPPPVPSRPVPSRSVPCRAVPCRGAQRSSRQRRRRATARSPRAASLAGTALAQWLRSVAETGRGRSQSGAPEPGVAGGCGPCCRPSCGPAPALGAPSARRPPTARAPPPRARRRRRPRSRRDRRVGAGRGRRSRRRSRAGLRGRRLLSCLHGNKERAERRAAGARRAPGDDGEERRNLRVSLR